MKNHLTGFMTVTGLLDSGSLPNDLTEGGVWLGPGIGRWDV
jgi:hypothetical protein